VAGLNRRWTVVSHPVGMPAPSNFSFDAMPIPKLGRDEVLLKLLYISIDPGQRVYISELVGPDAIGAPVKAWAVGRVVESSSPRFAVGSYARDNLGEAGVQEYSVIGAKDLVPVDPDPSLTAHLGLLGMPGLTAYFGMIDIAGVAPGETVVVSGASGAVGSIAGQIARIKGCRAVGITRGPEKARYLVDELGFDDAIDLLECGLAAGLAEKCPEGVDVYFDNVAGPMLDDMLGHMKRGGRIAFCGAVSQYNDNAPPPGITNYFQILMRELRWQGFYVGSHAGQFAAAVDQMREWVAAGRLVQREEVTVGIERFPQTLLDVFNDRLRGKMILQVSPGEVR